MSASRRYYKIWKMARPIPLSAAGVVSAVCIMPTILLILNGSLACDVYLLED